MTAAIALKPVLVSMASEISEMMLPASAATTVAPRMQSVPALHKMRTKPAGAVTASRTFAQHSCTLQQQHLKCLLGYATHCGGCVDAELEHPQVHIQVTKHTSLSPQVWETCAQPPQLSHAQSWHGEDPACVRYYTKCFYIAYRLSPHQARLYPHPSVGECRCQT